MSVRHVEVERGPGEYRGTKECEHECRVRFDMRVCSSLSRRALSAPVFCSSASAKAVEATYCWSSTWCVCTVELEQALANASPLPLTPLPNSSEATVIQSLEPLVGAGLASSTLGEPFPSPLGASLVIGGCLCSSLADGSTLGDKAGQQEKS